MKILGIETSCDETSASVVENGKKILSNIILSQIDIHKEFNGVVPELASRNHLKTIHQVINESLKRANLSWNEIDAIAVTQEPGLMGSLLIGLTVAKTLAFCKKKPLIPINHLMGHVYSANLEHDIEFPFIGLIVSGGHTLLTIWKDWKNYEIAGSTIDDAVGEAFDKVAKLLDLGYPGGPKINQMAKKGTPSIDFPLVILNYDKDRYNFSYSGLKTAVVYYIQRNQGFSKENLCASFQKKAIDVLFRKTKLICEDKKINRVVVAGGVAANSYLRELFDKSSLEVYIPSIKLCTDNAAMIAGLAYHQLCDLDLNVLKKIDAKDKFISKELLKKLRSSNEKYKTPF